MVQLNDYFEKTKPPERSKYSSLDEWRNKIIARGNVILEGLRSEEKIDLMKMSLEMLKMQIQNDKRFYENGIDAPSSYLWESQLSILGMMVSIIFPEKIKDFQIVANNYHNGSTNVNEEDPKSLVVKVLGILMSLEKDNPEIDFNKAVNEIIKQGIDEISVRNIIQKLVLEGIIFNPKLGKISILH